MNNVITGSSNRLVAYAVGENRNFSIVPASQDRAWMAMTSKKFANRCLPLLMANQFGWDIILNSEISCWWSGKDDKESLRVMADASASIPIADSHFGYGILTFRIPYVFRTGTDISLYVKGPVNHPKKSAVPLEGIVETDWSPMSFTMNWKITNRFRRVVFSKGEPIARIFPIDIGSIEKIRPYIINIDDDAETNNAHKLWSMSRSSFNLSLAICKDTQNQGWQKDYFVGRPHDGAKRITSHRTKIKLREFIDRRSARSS